MLLPVLGALTLVVLVGILSTVEYLRLVRSTRRRQLRANGLIRFGRSLRATGIQVVLALIAWPHVVEVALGMHRTPTATTPKTAYWKAGPLTLWRYDGGGGAPVLLVHSLVTRPSVLDLAPGMSLVEALLHDGHDVWLLDWGMPGRPQAMATLSNYGRLLAAAEQQVRAFTQSDVHLVGYCAGGLLALGWHGAHGHDGLASMTLIATPVDTAAAGGMGAFLRSPIAMPGLVLDGDGLVPASVVRESFRLLRPQALKTMRKLLRSRRDPLFRLASGALGRWAWDQTPVPGALVFDVLDLARGNTLMTGELELAGRRTDLSSLAGLPILLVTTVRDHIVPPASTLALRSVPGLDVEELQCSAGHVAMLAGVQAHEVLYPGLCGWLRRH